MKNNISNEDLVIAANTIRGLSIDAVQRANSGHPGMPLGMADVSSVLFLKYLELCSSTPAWPNRDRFVLSAGHGSVLLYSLLHMSGYDLPIVQLQQFRQLDSLMPGHPEFGHTPGVETTTGPLGQGCGNAVGMALTERILAERFNTPDFKMIDHYTYAIAGDGDLMEGISHEAFSLAGHLGLNKLIVFYDSNNITIEGSTSLACSDNVKKRFQGYNWNVLETDAHNFDEIEKATRKARREKTRPTLIICHSHIGHGSPHKADSASAHGEPLGVDEVKATKRNLGLPENEEFYVHSTAARLFQERIAQMKRKVSAWERKFRKYTQLNPEKAELWKMFFEDIIPADLINVLPSFDPAKPVATRAASGMIIQALAQALPQLVGGSADLAPSTKTLIKNTTSIGPGSFAGRNLHFGIREHAMGAIMNGIALHGGLHVFGATFFVFVDYLRPSLRLAALMNLPVVYVFTHDSFYVGEDGPTHEPVEQLASLRCMPNVTIIRPSDPTETVAAWIAALKNKTGPTVLLLTRQNLDIIDRSQFPSADNLEKGAYVLWQSGDNVPELTLLASGSEVGLAMKAAVRLASEINVRVVSMPSWELFDKQSSEYRASVIPCDCKVKISIEAGVSMGWEKYIGCSGVSISLNHFGKSAPYKELEKLFGFTVDNVISTARAQLQKCS